MSLPSFQCSTATMRSIASGCGSGLDGADLMGAVRLAFGNARRSDRHDHFANFHDHVPGKHDHVSSKHDHVSCKHDHVPSELNHVRSKHGHVSCGHDHGCADMIMSAANTIMSRAATVMSDRNTVMFPADTIMSARNTIMFRADTVGNARTWLCFQRTWLCFLAKRAWIRRARMPICGVRVRTVRPQTGHGTARVCPSKHPDGFREALF